MKKSILTILTLVPFILFAQSKKKPAIKQTEQSIIYSKAKKWFREVYVESTFKDPYSYKLIKSKIYPWSYFDEAQSRIERAKDELGFYREELLKLDSTTFKFKRYTDSLAKQTELIVTYQKVKNKKTMYYSVTIQCYGKNSYGANVLSNYHFDFNLDGLQSEVKDYDWY